MQLISLKHKIGQNFKIAIFDNLKIEVLKEIAPIFFRLGGKRIEDGILTLEGWAFEFPVCVNSEILEEIIKNTCFKCGGLMKNGIALDNTYVVSIDFPDQTDFKGCTQSKIGQPNIVNVSKCISCGHSHT